MREYNLSKTSASFVKSPGFVCKDLSAAADAVADCAGAVAAFGCAVLVWVAGDGAVCCCAGGTMSTTPELSCASSAGEKRSALITRNAGVARNEQQKRRFGEVFALRIEGVTGILERYQKTPAIP
jgi:hypothetical protein